jgi:hypothetical protein
MALPTINQQYTLDVIYLGGPFVQVAAKIGIDFNTLDIVYLGSPFWGLTPEEVTGVGFDSKRIRFSHV